MDFQTINPASQIILGEYSYDSWTQLDAKVNLLEKAQNAFLKKTQNARLDLLLKWSEGIEADKKNIAALISQEMGKPIVQSIAEVAKCIATLRYLALYGANWLQPEKVQDPETLQNFEIHLRPLGVIFAIMPWNFPLWQAVRCAGLALLGGNAVLFKPANLTAGTAVLLQKAFDGTSSDLVKTIFVDHTVAKKVIEDPRIAAVSFTGSTAAGRTIATIASAALKKIVLELGGSDAAVVFADADLSLAASKILQSRMQNAGQSCVALKRAYIEESCLEEFLKFAKIELTKYQPQNPLEKETLLGPLASLAFKEKFISQQIKAETLGFKSLSFDKLEGEDAQAVGSNKNGFVKPSILVAPKSLSKEIADWVATEEIFGPALLVFSFKSENEALTLVNSSDYGLGGSIFSKSKNKFIELSCQLKTGGLAWNDMIRSTVIVPFGGVKNSGWGRELSRYGLLEFCNIQTLYLGSEKT